MIYLCGLLALGAAATSSVFALRRYFLPFEIWVYWSFMLMAARQSLLIFLTTPGLLALDESWPGFLSGLFIDYVLLPVAFLWVLAGLWSDQTTAAGRALLICGWTAGCGLLAFTSLRAGVIRLQAPAAYGVMPMRIIGILAASWLFAVGFRLLLRKEGKLI